jgi:hypothetical protein
MTITRNAFMKDLKNFLVLGVVLQLNLWIKTNLVLACERELGEKRRPMVNRAEKQDLSQILRGKFDNMY